MLRCFAKQNYQPLTHDHCFFEFIAVLLRDRYWEEALVVECVIIQPLRIMILPVPIAQFNAVVLRNGVLVARVDWLDRHFVEDFQQLGHDLSHLAKVAIWDDASRLLALALLLVVVSDQLLIRLNKSLKEVDKAGKRMRTVLVLQVWRHRVVLLRHVVVEYALHMHDHIPVLFTVSPTVSHTPNQHTSKPP